MKLAHVLPLVALVGCSKTEGPPSPEPTPPPPTTFQIIGTPPSATAPASASASASAAAPASAAASASARPATSASAGKDAPLKPASTKITGNHFALDVASPGCRDNQPCAMTIKLAVTGDYHVNKEYPYKFVATPALRVTFLGNGDENTFSRAAGDFKEEGEKAATMTVRFKASGAGTARVTGTYKMSVCSAENCQIEQQAVTLDVPVI